MALLVQTMATIERSVQRCDGLCKSPDSEDILICIGVFNHKGRHAAWDHGFFIEWNGLDHDHNDG